MLYGKEMNNSSIKQLVRDMTVRYIVISFLVGFSAALIKGKRFARGQICLDSHYAMQITGANTPLN